MNDIANVILYNYYNLNIVSTDANMKKEDDLTS